MECFIYFICSNFINNPMTAQLRCDVLSSIPRQGSKKNLGKNMKKKIRDLIKMQLKIVKFYLNLQFFFSKYTFCWISNCQRAFFCLFPNYIQRQNIIFNWSKFVLKNSILKRLIFVYEILNLLCNVKHQNAYSKLL